MKKIILVLGILISLSFLGLILGGKLIGKKDTPKPQIIRNDFGVPQSLAIEKLGVEATVESVGMDEKGRMDVPKGVMNVAWYNLGAKPGDNGSAVLAGHLDTPQGKPAVFYSLGTLKKGDEIKVTNSKGKKLIYVVEKIATYDTDKFPLVEVFADASGKRLNLITCNGTWDKNNKNYLKRLVVYSTLKK